MKNGPELRISEGNGMVDQKHSSMFLQILNCMHLEGVGIRILKNLEVLSSIVYFVGEFII